MWEGWKKTKDSDRETVYSRLLSFEVYGREAAITLTAMLLRQPQRSADWKVLITAFSPSAGEYVDFEGTYPSFGEAEAKAWEKAQAAVQIRSDSKASQ